MKTDPLQRIRELANQEITAEERRACLDVLKAKKVAIFVVAYNAERHLESLMDRIPKDLLPLFAEIFVIDDSSSDSTYDVAKRIRQEYSSFNVTVYRTPFNRGYGGNQKLGYLYCLERRYDIGILLHGDGQYAPEYIPRILAPFVENPDAVFASRMLRKRLALKGGMPFYKWVGNQILTAFENKMMGAHLSEFHTGFRAYSISALEKIPFVFNSDDFHFDTEIIVQALAQKWRIMEVSIPAYYGDEQCHVNGMKYAYNCVKSVIKYHLVYLGLFYQRNYDFGLFDTENYQYKKSPNSLHQYILRKGEFKPDMMTIELGANRGIVSSHIAPRVKEHFAIDIGFPDLAGNSIAKALNLNTSFSEVFPKKAFDVCLAMDVIEHLNEAEHFLTEIFEILKINGKLYISTANVCYLPIRLAIAFGQFNYGKRGILDRTHKRLFSVSSFKKILSQYGFEVDQISGFAPPLVDLISQHRLMKIFERFHAFFSRLFPSVFAYNFLVVARRMDGLSDIFERTLHAERYPGIQQELPLHNEGSLLEKSASGKKL